MLTQVLLAVLTALCAVLLLFSIAEHAAGKRREEELSELHRELMEYVEETAETAAGQISGRVSDIQGDIGRRLAQDAQENRENRRELSDTIARANKMQQEFSERFSKRQQELLAELSRQQEERLSAFSETQARKLSELSEKQLERMNEQTAGIRETLTRSLRELQETNREKLGEIQGEINRKLDTSLNERLDSSFKTVGEQLQKLYQSLGELGKLENGVMSLNRTLSNVKARGVLGETQLENILAEILSNTLYDRNVATKKGSRDCVEFAVRIPDKEAAGSFLYLPIDSKFPTSIYDRICEAADEGDADALRRAQKELEQRIRTEARTIFEKYVDPPQTTDFALMFLPTESLYAEVLRIPGLTEECQRKYHVVVTGPTTIAALLNSLSIGFRYMAVNRDSQNILKLLSAIKTQYSTLSTLIETAGNRLELAKKATSELRHRTDIINKRLASVEEIDATEARQLLGISVKAEQEEKTPEA